VLAGFRQANIRLLVISGDNPSTVAALAYQAGFDPQSDPAISGLALQSMSPGEFAEAVRSHSIFGRITPEQKSQIVDVLRGDGAYVAMMGDGVNDVLSLKKAQVGIAMEDGSAATRAVADIVLLGNRFEILPQAFLEGQRILNGMNDSSRLFLTRSVYIALLIITAGFIGSESPFSPRHNALLTSLPVGIPAFFLAYWAKTGQLSRGLIASTLEFVLPAGLSLFGVNIFLWLYYLQHLEAGVDVARTALTTASLLGALWCVIIAEHPRHWWKTAGLNHFGDRRRVGLVLAMLALFIVVMLWPAARGFFQMEVLAAADYSLIGLVLIVWAACLQALWRFDLLERLLIPNYREGSHDGPAAG
jgi:cation-transporting ATPase E